MTSFSSAFYGKRISSSHHILMLLRCETSFNWTQFTSDYAPLLYSFVQLNSSTDSFHHSDGCSRAACARITNDANSIHWHGRRMSSLTEPIIVANSLHAIGGFDWHLRKQFLLLLFPLAVSLHFQTNYKHSTYSRWNVALPSACCKLEDVVSLHTHSTHAR